MEGFAGARAPRLSNFTVGRSNVAAAANAPSTPDVFTGELVRLRIRLK